MALKKRTFHELLHSLPQELYDEIYDHTFEYGATTTVVRVTKDYRPPALLQIDRDTRAKFAEAYYSKSVFVTAFATKFLAPLSGEHVMHFRDIRAAREANPLNLEGCRRVRILMRYGICRAYFRQDRLEESLEKYGLK